VENRNNTEVGCSIGEANNEKRCEAFAVCC
jgi:hypothetical protein